MTVKELDAVLDTECETNILDTNGCIMALNRLDSIPLAAYGDFIIKCIRTHSKGIEIELQLQPIKKG